MGKVAGLTALVTASITLNSFSAFVDPGETAPVNDWTVKTKLRGMVVRFQREMNGQ